ncbi:NUDIX hydrolase [Shewanella sp. Isolate7]|uniref:NUDIX hydrolase n=1 Tax=Shewanella sp. Isolate7 TaxID=2908528 RepID=UPI001EFC6E33|nr:NUDIX hydrolase [Shewanella sp. Isolate7]MCG9722230.1 NUDIX hydrolase [Shewanella sp. Isolate7]
MERYKPNVTVACVIASEDKYLMVEELIDGKLTYNQPAGHLEAFESLNQACEREVWEETGLSIQVQSLINIYQFQANEDLAFLRFTYACVLNEQLTPAPQDSAIRRALWMTYDEIAELKTQLRSPLVLQCIDDFHQGTLFSTEVVNSRFL